MQHLNLRTLFKFNRLRLSLEQREFLDRSGGGDWSFNTSTGLVDVNGGFYCSCRGISNLRGIRFGSVRDSFDCSYNNLKSLEGAPHDVGGSFYCTGNSLESLAGAPETVGGSFLCDEFEIPPGEWNPDGWLKVIESGSDKGRKLVLPLVSVCVLNRMISVDPASVMLKLKPVWSDPEFSGIRSRLIWPNGYEKEADLVGDLGNVGY